MISENTDILNELQEIMDKHRNPINDHNKILSNYSYKKMSVGDSIYGMHFPEQQLEKYFEYDGKLTEDERKKDFVYYFDKNNKLILTERYSNGSILNIILFYYFENKIEIVWYCMKRKKVNVIGKIVYQNNNLTKFIESGNITRGINSFKEYLFNTNDDNINIKSYMKYSSDKEIVMNSKMKKKN